MAAIVLSNAQAKKLGLSVEVEPNKPLTLVQIGFAYSEESDKYFLSTLTNEVLVRTNDYTRGYEQTVSSSVYTGKELYEKLNYQKEDNCNIPNEEASTDDLYFSVDAFGMITAWHRSGNIIVWTSEMDTNLFETPYTEYSVYNKALELYGISDL